MLLPAYKFCTLRLYLRYMILNLCWPPGASGLCQILKFLYLVLCQTLLFLLTGLKNEGERAEEENFMLKKWFQNCGSGSTGGLQPDFWLVTKE